MEEGHSIGPTGGVPSTTTAPSSTMSTVVKVALGALAVGVALVLGGPLSLGIIAVVTVIAGFYLLRNSTSRPYSGSSAPTRPWYNWWAGDPRAWFFLNKNPTNRSTAIPMHAPPFNRTNRSTAIPMPPPKPRRSPGVTTGGTYLSRPVNTGTFQNSSVNPLSRPVARKKKKPKRTFNNDSFERRGDPNSIIKSVKNCPPHVPPHVPPRSSTRRSGPEVIPASRALGRKSDARPTRSRMGPPRRPKTRGRPLGNRDGS